MEQEYPFRPRGRQGFDREDVINYIAQAQQRCNEHLERMEQLEAAKNAWYAQAKGMEREKATLVVRVRELEEQLENAVTENQAMSLFSTTEATEPATLLATMRAYFLDLKCAIAQQEQTAKEQNSLIVEMKSQLEAEQKAKEEEERKAKATRIAIRKEIFISYAHADKQYRDELHPHLKMLERSTKIEWWDDTQIRSGDVWEDKISDAFSRTKVAILMVSADFFASEYVWNKELPKILAAAAAEGAVILWLPIRACGYKDTDIAKYQAITNPVLPLARRSRAERDEVYAELFQRIREIFYIAPNS